MLVVLLFDLQFRLSSKFGNVVMKNTQAILNDLLILIIKLILTSAINHNFGSEWSFFV